MRKRAKTKLKKKPHQKIKKVNLPTKITKSLSSTHDYYCCCSEQTKSGLAKGTKITQVTQHCKQNAQKLMVARQQFRDQEKKKILENWKQIGTSLGKIIDKA